MGHRSNTPDDEKAVSLALADSKEAFVVLLRRYHASVFGMCKGILNSESDAHDIVQEAALQAFLGLETLREPERFEAWLHSIAANLARARLRQKRRRPTLSLEPLAGAISEHDTDGSYRLATERWLVDEAPGPEEVRLARELHDEIIQAIKLLSSPNQEAVIGYYLQGYSQAELAELLGVPVGTIKGRLHKSRKQLGSTLEPVARQVLGTTGKEKETMSEEQMVEVAVEDALKMPFDDERGLEMLRTGGSLRDLPYLAASEAPTSFPTIAVVLKEENGERVLPVWMGISEGLSIWSSVSGREMPRPMTHDLMRELLGAVKIEVERVAVVRLAEDTFYGEINLRQKDGEEAIERRVDSRPSDAIALAVRLGTPIYVAQSVLDEAAFESKEVLLEAQREGRGSFSK